MKKLTKEEFILKANQIHGFKYSYLKTTYKNSRTKICITCPVHGDFEQVASSHLTGRGCNDCGNEVTRSKTKKNSSKFQEEANLVHENKYSYPELNYVNTHTKITIQCPIHGQFQQKPIAHLQGQGCYVCSLGQAVGFNKGSFVKKAQEKYNNQATLYVIRCHNDSEDFIKVGITLRSVDKRFDSKYWMPYEWESLLVKKGDAKFIWELEKELHKTLRQFKHNPQIGFGGKNECFEKSCLKDVEIKIQETLC